MRDRIRAHHVAPRKDWFGILFAIPIVSTILVQAIEAELIRLVREASVVSVVTNQAQEGRFLDTDDVHVAPALDGIIDGLEMLLEEHLLRGRGSGRGGQQDRAAPEACPDLQRRGRARRATPT